uniref:PiggyBac transposable element-derived protein 4-like n=1 Tax=Callorhinchus milii TaxID=7868 RepID=A0A4W3GL10_CALMI
MSPIEEDNVSGQEGPERVTTTASQVMSESESDEDVFKGFCSEELSSPSGDEAEHRGYGDWSMDLHDVCVPSFTEPVGPQHQLSTSASPLSYFNLLWPDTVFGTVAEETNRYADQCQESAGKRDPCWTPTNAREIKTFFAINIMMGIKQLPRISLYWSQDTALRCPWASSAMSRDRFWKVNQYLHLQDNRKAAGKSDPGHDPIYKVRALTETVRRHFGQSYRPSRDLSVDEGMVAYKGRLYFKQYVPNKPTKWGLKVWMLCEAVSGYCLNFSIYTGQRPYPSGKGTGYDVVMDLCSPYFHRNHHVYFDRFFTYPDLLEDLQRISGTKACATVHLNRKGLPAGARQLKLKTRGQVRFFQKGALLLTVWKDKRQVAVLSTNQSGKMVLDSGTLKPQSVIDYNKHMGGVDISDQMRSYYPVGRPSKKWWRCILWYLVNITIVNAWLIFKRSPHHPPLASRYDHLTFRIALAKLLRGDYSAGAGGRGKLSASAGTKFQKTVSGRSVETSFKCEFCDIPLCRVNCFRDYHQSLP